MWSQGKSEIQEGCGCPKFVSWIVFRQTLKVRENDPPRFSGSAICSVSSKRCSPQKVFRAFLTHVWRILERSSFPNQTRPILAHFWRISDAFLTHSCYCRRLFRKHLLDDTEMLSLSGFGNFPVRRVAPNSGRLMDFLFEDRHSLLELLWKRAKKGVLINYPVLPFLYCWALLGWFSARNFLAKMGDFPVFCSQSSMHLAENENPWRFWRFSLVKTEPPNLVAPCGLEFNRGRGRGWELQPLSCFCFASVSRDLGTIAPQSRGWAP